MARDFLALQNEVKQFGYGDRELPFIKSWLNEASWDVASRSEWRWLDATIPVSTVANQGYIEIDEGTVMFTSRLRPNLAGMPEPRYVSWDSYADQFHREATTTQRGVPTMYSLRDGQIKLHPVPDAVYSYTIPYQRVPAEMVADADVPWMPTEHRGVLVSGAMMRMAARDKDFNAVQYWQDQYEGQISKMRMANSKTDSGRPHKVPMPGSYGWGN